jgi:hypothetical protein
MDHHLQIFIDPVRLKVFSDLAFIDALKRP